VDAVDVVVLVDDGEEGDNFGAMRPGVFRRVLELAKRLDRGRNSAMVALCAVSDKPTIPSSSVKQQATLNALGLIVLLVGIGSACIVYWIGQNRHAGRSNRTGTSTAGGDWKDGTLSLEDSKIASRDIEMYYGKAGVLTVRALNWLRRPKTQAILLATVSTLIAFGCFFVARRLFSDAPPST